MKKMKIIRVSWIVLFLFIIGCLTTFTKFSSYASASETTTFVQEESLKEYYNVGDTLSIPDGKFGSVKATALLTSPNGEIKKSVRHTFESAGIYYLQYEAEINGKVLKSEKQEIKVYDNLLVTSTANARAEYQKDRVLVDENGNETTVSGISVSLTSSAVFTYNKVVNLSGKTVNDCIFEYNVVASKKTKHADTQKEIYIADFYKVTVRFTDLYDSTNYVDFVVQLGNDGTVEKDYVADIMNYSRAGHSGEKTKGYSYGYLFSEPSQYGTYAPVSFLNRHFNPMPIYFDYAERKVFGAWMIGEEREMVVDLDDKVCFENTWNGFTTGECLVSVFAEDFNTSEGEIFIRSIVGESGDDFADNIVYDNRAPIVSVDYGGYNLENLPFAIKGEKYPIYDATAMDILGNVRAISKDVYYNYYSNVREKVEIRDNCFIPHKTGAYTIVYTAIDYFGNKGYAYVDVSCYENQSAPIQIELQNIVGEASTGEQIKLASATISGASGNSVLNVSVEKNGVFYAIDAEKLIFQAMEAGEYTVRYTASDYTTRRYEKSYILTITNSNAPVFTEDPIFPKYYIAGYEQTVPELKAIDFSNNGTSIVSEIWVKEGDDAPRKIIGNLLTPEVKDKKVYNLEVIYKAIGVNGVNSVSYSLPCYSIYLNGQQGKIDKSSLFVTDEEISTAFEKVSADSSYYATYTTKKDAEMTYINTLPAHNLSLEFNIFKAGSGFEKLNIWLTDSINEKQQIKLTYVKNGTDSVYFVLNDDKQLYVDAYSFFKQDTRLVFEFDNYYGIAYTAGRSAAIQVTKDINGHIFNGFESNKVYLRVEFEGVQSVAKIAIRKVCNQTIGDSTRDNAESILTINGEYQKYYAHGEKLELLPVVVNDMIMPYINCTFDVTSPTGEYVTATDGTLLKGIPIGKIFTIELSKYGVYTLHYDLDDNSSITEYLFNVIDQTAPVVKVNNEPNAEYNVGDTFKINFSASDEAKDITMFVSININGRWTTVSNGDTIKFTQAGMYKIHYIAYDEQGNEALVSYSIRVREN